MIDLYILEKNGSKIYIIDVVKGLSSEAERTIKLVEKIDFDIGGITVSDGELEGLVKLVKDEVEVSIEPNEPERIYAKNLGRFGDVSLPPPSFVTLLKYCRKNDIQLIALDMDEEHYSMAYCENVSGAQWIMQSLREKRLKRKNFDSNTPKDFAIEWDKTINKLKGFQELEDYREAIITKNLIRLSRKGDTVVIIEVERVKGIVGNMEEKGWKILSR